MYRDLGHSHSFFNIKPKGVLCKNQLHKMKTTEESEQGVQRNFFYYFSRFAVGLTLYPKCKVPQKSMFVLPNKVYLLQNKKLNHLHFNLKSVIGITDAQNCFHILRNTFEFYKNILCPQGYLESLERFHLTRFLQNVSHKLKLEITVKKKLKQMFKLLGISDEDLF